MNSLEQLYREVDSCKFCAKEKNSLRHIHGAGAMRPRLMLVLINPTYRNISAHAGYEGPQFPFLGVRQFWNILADGGLIAKHNLPLRAEWNAGHTTKMRAELVKNKLFLTNIVKCCYDHSAYPSKEVIEAQKKFLGEEITLVKPQRIVAFGALVYKTLTGKDIKLSDPPKREDIGIFSGLNIPVSACYFPIGRGSPAKAIKILKQLT